jgi:hypothetical protein
MIDDWRPYGLRMILFDLRCTKGHVFEAWFRDNASFDSQAEAGAVNCPACGSRKVEKAPMAPRIGKGNEVGRQQMAKELTEMKRQLKELQTKIEANCDYVGNNFAEEARRIHYGEAAHRDIYGEATDEEAKELNEEGIDFARIPWPQRHDS